MIAIVPPPVPDRALIDRRGLFRGGIAGLGLVAVPSWAATLEPAGFTHGVASGEPGASEVLLWTRYVDAGGAARLRFEVAETLDFARSVAGSDDHFRVRLQTEDLAQRLEALAGAVRIRRESEV